VKEYYWDEMELTLNISSDDEQLFDVYIMDSDQYYASYVDGNESAIAFSYMYKAENVHQLQATIDLKNNNRGIVYVVIENRDNPISEDDAVPSGPITIHALIIEYEEYGGYD